jgi:WD40 repeat protein
MARHLLIAIATSKYPNLKPDDGRPQLAQVLASVVDLFTSTLGRYQRELPGIAENPPSNVLRSDLDDWFGDSTRDATDWVVVYYTGHAEVVGNEFLYLLTSDFKPNKFVASAFSLGQFAELVLAGREDGSPRPVRNLLLIVDTCFAGKGTAELTSKLSAVFRKNSAGSFYLLGAALPRQEAQAGALAKALIQAIGELSKRYVMQEWLYFDQVVPAINQLLEKSGVQRAVLSALDASSEEPKFFPNPSFVPTDRAAVPADEAARAISDQEFRDHWGPRSRGVELDSDPGSYFSGRNAVLEKLGAFLSGRTDNAMRIVTGRPGAGKSAILSRLVTMSRPGYASDLAAELAPIDLAVHAKGKSAHDVTARVAKVLDVEPKMEAILESLRRSSRPLRIVVDALDESMQPAEIASQLLRPLNSIDSVRLLVGTRANQLAALGGGEVIDIDEPKYAKKTDIAEYVKARLLRSGEPGRSTPYTGKAAVAERVATMVAENAYPNFLVARLTVEDLLSRKIAANPSSPKEMAFPTRVPAAFETYLSRFGEKEEAVRDLLLPLAYAEGQGLPWDNIWAPLASSLSRRKYADEDVRWLLANAGAFVLESSEGGRSVYRLYHQALADYLRSGKRTISIHRTFVKVLTDTVPPRPEGDGPSWLLANRYVRSHLATHAVAPGSLASLVVDPLYLLAADARRLLSSIWLRWNDVPRDVVAVYRQAASNIRGDSPAVSASHLELIARKRRLADFADRTARLPLSQPFRTPWARWIPQASSHSFGKGESQIHSLAVAEWEPSRMVALVGRMDGAVEVWDIASAERLVRWKPDDADFARHLTVAKTPRGPLLLASWSNGRFGVYDPMTGDTVLKQDVGKKGPDDVTAMCLVERNGEEVCVTAHRSMKLVVRSLRTLQPIVEREDAGLLYRLRSLRRGDRTVLFSAGDNYPCDFDEPKSADSGPPSLDPSILRLWSVDDLSLLWRDVRDRVEILDGIEQGVLFGRRTIVAFRATASTEIWDVENPRLLFKDSRFDSYDWLYEFKGDALLLSAGYGRLRVQRLDRTGTGDTFSLVPSDYGSPVNIQGYAFTGIFRLQGRPTILSASVDQVRVWDLEDLLVQAATKSAGDDADKNSLAGAEAMVAASSGELYVAALARIVALDGSTGEVLWEKNLGGKEVIVQLKLAREERWLIAGAADGVLHVLDKASRGETVRAIKVGDRLEAVECLRWRGLDIAVVTASHGRVWSARIWDLVAGAEIPTGGAYQLRHGEEDKPMAGLAVAIREPGIRIAFASKYGKVMVANYAWNPRDDYSPFEEWHIRQSSGEYVESLTIGDDAGHALLAAGSEDGLLAVWRFDDGAIVATRAHAHVTKVGALLFGELSGRKVLVSGGADGTLRFWDLKLTELLRIDFGEPISAMTWIGTDRLAVAGSAGVATFEFPKRDAR